MWVINLVFRAFALFVVPVVILTVYFNMRLPNHVKAVGLAVIQAYGPFFVLTGLFYVAFGAFLWSPLPQMLFRYILEKHFGVSFST